MAEELKRFEGKEKGYTPQRAQRNVFKSRLEPESIQAQVEKSAGGILKVPSLPLLRIMFTHFHIFLCVYSDEEISRPQF